jgi:hypothetical protein
LAFAQVRGGVENQDPEFNPDNPDEQEDETVV